MTHDEICDEVQRRAEARGILSHYCKAAVRCVGTPGMPDILLVGRNGVAWIEVKTAGDRVKPDQTRWKYALQGAGQVHRVFGEWHLMQSGHVNDLLDELAGEVRTEAGPCYGAACDHVSHRPA